MTASLSPSQCQMLRDQIVATRAQNALQADALQREFDEIVASAQLANTDDEHDPEGSTIAYERQKTASLLQRARANTAELDRALVSLDEGTYGRCKRCRREIAFDRLMTIPNAIACIACAS